MSKTWMAIGALILFTSVAWSQAPATPAKAPTTAPAAADPADEKAMLEALKKKIEAQDRRIAELEAKQGGDQKMRREEIIAVLKEMNLLNDKKAGDMRVYYNDGLKFETADGNFRMGLNGRIFEDTAYVSAGGISHTHPANKQVDGTELREVRIKMVGDIYKDYFYCLEVDLAHSTVAMKDIYFGMKNIPVIGNIRAGHFQEPFSMDDLLSDSTQTFMERSLASALDGSPDRNDGIMANNVVLDKRMTWAFGIFRPTNTAGNDIAETDKGYDFTGRVTGLPYYANDGKQLIHLGAAYSYRTMNDTDKLTYSEAPEIDSNLTNGLKYISTDGINAKNANLFGGEFATVWNSFHAESEFMASKVDTNNGSNPCYKGFYAQAGYFLTGEVRPYNRATGIFDRVRPLKNFRDGDGLGAWEIAARYSYLDLDEEGIGKDRGTLNDVTLGVNWYLNPMMRIMWNYIHVMPDTVLADESSDMFMMRFQIDF
jgi:phosphate-selective porin OprO/OprP